MKALVIAPIDVARAFHFTDTIARALNEYGFDTRTASFFVTTPPGLVNRIRIDAAMTLKYRKYYDEYVREFNEKLIALYKVFHPDLVLVIRGSKVTASTLNYMSSAIRVLWCHDIVRRCDLTLEQLRCYDRLLVFEASDVPWLADHFNLEAHSLPMGFDPEVYHPLPNTPKDIDVFLVGRYYQDRRLVLERLAQDFPQYTLRFYGRHVRYREPSTWKRYFYYALKRQGDIFVNRDLDSTDVNHMYARAKICINMHHTQNVLTCNSRVFEIMGARGFQLVDDLPYLKENMKNLLITYGNYDQLCSSIERYLHDEQLRNQIAEEAYQVALKQHTYVHRIHKILQVCNLLPKPKFRASPLLNRE